MTLLPDPNNGHKAVPKNPRLNPVLIPHKHSLKPIHLEQLGHKVHNPNGKLILGKIIKAIEIEDKKIRQCPYEHLALPRAIDIDTAFQLDFCQELMDCWDLEVEVCGQQDEGLHLEELTDCVDVVTEFDVLL